jgi:transcription antitermination protein NusB
MGLRRKSRELALQFLFSHDFTGAADEPKALALEMERFCDSFETGKKALPYAQELISGICSRREEIDRELADRSHNWRLERMSLVDRNILRIAVFEMKFCQDVPAKVAINEALEIAKLYSIPDSVAFINGILDAVQGRVEDSAA